MIFALLITWGGAAVCIAIAMRASRRNEQH
ncbi:MetS family NSS transporter small subunit [Shewanella halifaxensis]|nr:MetS family NSS transporter small subunit [Shewanella halifaxensis]